MDGVPEVRTMPAKPYRILIVDDHMLVRRGLRALLEAQPGMEVCSEASTGLEAIEYLKRDKPDLIVLDLTMPDMDGLEVARAVKQESPSTEVLVLTMHFSEELAREVIRSGALGYVLKSDADSELLAAVDHARHHQPFFTSKLAITMAQNFAQGPGDSSGAGNDGQSGRPRSRLTPREIEVVKLLAGGKINKEVATALGISTRTIESHRSHIMHKMNFASFSDLVRFATRSGIVETQMNRWPAIRRT
jgi:DNA-binding NarL/FixJ family response regulator